MPTIRTETIVEWACGRCGHTDEVVADTEEYPYPHRFSKNRASMMLNSVWVDSRGVKVGPGPLHTEEPFDLCDSCFDALVEFWKSSSGRIS